MTSVARWWRLGAIAVVVAAAAAGCSTKGLVFRDSGTLRITSPRERAKLHLPVTIEWTLRDGARAPASYAVVIDRPAPRVGHGLPRADDRKGITVTRDMRLVLPRLFPRGAVGTRNRDVHDVTVVMLDEQGRRISEAGDTVQFEIER